LAVCGLACNLIPLLPLCFLNLIDDELNKLIKVEAEDDRDSDPLNEHKGHTHKQNVN